MAEAGVIDLSGESIYYIGWDPSLRSSGLVVLDENHQVLEWGAITNDKENCILYAIELERVMVQLRTRYSMYGEVRVRIEKYLRGHRGGHFNSSTLTQLAEVNGMVQMAVYNTFGIQAVLVASDTARSLFQLPRSGSKLPYIAFAEEQTCRSIEGNQRKTLRMRMY